MKFKEYMTKPKIISLIMVFCLVIFCFIVARIGMRRIIEPETPLSSTNIEAMFYVAMPDNGQIVCIGDGLINSSEEKSGEIAVERTVVTAPDNSAFVGNAYHVVWNNIKHGENGIEVYGDVASGPKSAKGDVTSVRDFGAVGDGVTDDTVAINKALNATSGGILYFPSGTYVISKGVRVRSNTHVVGDGKTSIIIAKEGTTRGSTMLKLENNSNVVFDNICVSGNSSVNYENMDAQDGIHLLDIWNSDTVTVKNCYFIDNIYTGIRDINSSNITVENCTFKNTDCGFITLGGGIIQNIKIRNNILDGHQASEPISLFADAPHSNVIIENNKISNKTFGCGIYVDGKQHNNNIQIINNSINSCAGGIRVINTSNALIQGNTVTNTTSGCGFRIQYCTNTIFKDNSCDNIKNDGLEVKDCTDITITNLTATDCGRRNDNYFNVRFTGDSNENVTFIDSKISYNDTSQRIGLCFACDTDISMNNIDYGNASVWLTKNTENTSLTVPEAIKVINNGQANEITRY